MSKMFRGCSHITSAGRGGGGVGVGKIFIKGSLKVKNNVSVLYPPIQEEVTIRKNIARGPQGRGQYFSVLSPPLGLGGIIRTLSITLPIFRHAIKVNIATVPV